MGFSPNFVERRKSSYVRYTSKTISLSTCDVLHHISAREIPANRAMLSGNVKEEPTSRMI